MQYCSNCDSIQEISREGECENCGHPLVDQEETVPLQKSGQGGRLVRAAEAAPQVRYPAVRTLSMVFRILAFLSLGAGVIVAGLAIVVNSSGGLAFSLLLVLCGGGVFIFLLALAEGFRIVVDIEANTRASVELLSRSGK